ncbi:putative recombinase [Bdellovibrio phage phi1422]|uniref:RecE-like recombination exonuclease n=1 Tax=Bdellovibrio phage phi1422 TaxID=1127515 RepID=UPI0002536D0C|nr:RecE-like recombination exonuclease [Bdellovibrio phage phi1422]AFC22533.1 putative recombinase [Bdellovibrio phage phi1422]
MMFNTRLEWLQWRKGGIGGSDANMLMGVSKHGTRLDLYGDKSNPEVTEDEGNYITDKGNEYEVKMRSTLEIWEGKSFAPALCQSEDFPFMLASLDGASEDREEIAEFKMVGKEDFEFVKTTGQVLPQYKPQVHHNLAVTGAKVCHFGVCLYEKGKKFNSENFIVIKVTPDFEYITELIKSEMEFWNENVLKKRPPVPTDRDYVNLKGQSPILTKWKKVQEKLEKLEAEEKELRAQIIAECEKQGHGRYLTSNVRIRQESRKGSVDYAKIPAIKEMSDEDLDKYRKKGSTSWKMEIITEKETENE